jgi:hypothetical protein
MLKRKDVNFLLIIEPETESPEGWFAYDTEEKNRDAAQWIRDQLAAGNDLAWCSVLVTCKPKDERIAALVEPGFASLGAVSCANQADFDSLVLDHGLKDKALDCLNEKIETTQAKCRAFESALCVHGRG